MKEPMAVTEWRTLLSSHQRYLEGNRSKPREQHASSLHPSRGQAPWIVSQGSMMSELALPEINEPRLK